MRLFGAVALSAAIAFGVLLVSTVGEEFGTVGLTAAQWAAALALALLPLIVPELWKLRRPRRATGPRLRPAGVHT